SLGPLVLARVPEVRRNVCHRYAPHYFLTRDVTSPSLLDSRWIKRRLDDPGRSGLAADLDGEVGADGSGRGVHVRQRDRFVDRWTVRAGRDHAERAPVLDDRVAVTCDRAIGHLEADQPAPWSSDTDLLDRVAADELALGRLDHPPEAGLDRI